MQYHPKVQAYAADLTMRYFKGDIPDILMALRDSAKSGNVEAAKVFLSHVMAIEKQQAEQTTNVFITRNVLVQFIASLKGKQI